MIKVAQIGVGYWGKNLLRVFNEHPQVQVQAVCDLNADIRSRVSREYANIAVYSNLEDLFSDSEIDAVVIATEPVTHYEICKRALLEGKHVFVEKPMVLEIEHGEELVKLAEQQKKTLMVGHLLEYHPVYVKTHELIKEGELGEVYYVYSTRVNLGVVRKDENSLWSLAPHDISVALMLMGETPTRVVSTGQSYLQKGIEDVVFTTIHFSDKKIAHIHVSWLDPHKIRKLTVVGSKKMAVIDDMESTEKMRIYDKGVDLRVDFAAYTEALTLRIGDILIPNIKMQEPLKLECAHFVECVLEGKRPKSDGWDGL
ncbi:MAG: Gfo/Idh/MocA family protein, partial [Candidatus Zixiibacteriota bacterium]